MLLKCYRLINVILLVPQIIQRIKWWYTNRVRNIKDKLMFSPSLKLHYLVYVNLLSLYCWMQVTLISFHYLIKHDLIKTSLMNIYINKLIYYRWTYYLDIYHRWTHITWTWTTARCVMFGYKPQLDMYYWT